MDMNALLRAPLTRADFRELASRHGRPSPSPTDAMRYGALCMRISPLLKRLQPGNTEEHDVTLFATKLQLALDVLPDGSPPALLASKRQLGAGMTPVDRERMFERLVAPLLALQDAGGGAPPPSVFVTEPIFTSHRQCATCGKAGDALLKCGQCRSVLYCDVSCQRKGWKSHKESCVPVHTEVQGGAGGGRGSA